MSMSYCTKGALALLILAAAPAGDGDGVDGVGYLPRPDPGVEGQHPDG